MATETRPDIAFAVNNVAVFALDQLSSTEWQSNGYSDILEVLITLDCSTLNVLKQMPWLVTQMQIGETTATTLSLPLDTCSEVKCSQLDCHYIDEPVHRSFVV